MKPIFFRLFRINFKIDKKYSIIKYKVQSFNKKLLMFYNN